IQGLFSRLQVCPSPKHGYSLKSFSPCSRRTAEGSVADSTTLLGGLRPLAISRSESQGQVVTGIPPKRQECRSLRACPISCQAEGLPESARKLSEGQPSLAIPPVPVPGKKVPDT